MITKQSTSFAKKLFLLFAAAALLAPQQVSAAIPYYTDIDGFIDQYAANNIMFYNPLDCVGGKTGGNTVLAGNTTKERIWNYLIGKGFSDAQAAGIMGNIAGESGFTITRASNSMYWGLFQWRWDYNEELRRQINEAGLSQYTGSEWWASGADENMPQEDYNRLLQIELDYMMTNNAEEWQSIIKEKAGDAHEPEYAAEVFLVHFERAVYGDESLKYYEDRIYHGGMQYQGVTHRNDAAREIYEEYAGKGITAQGTGGYTITDGANLTWIGDSLSAIWERNLKELLPQVETHVQSGKTFNHDVTEGSGGSSGMKILKNLHAVRDIFVFALGTNDWNVSDAQIKSVHDDAIAKGAKVIVFMTARTRDNDYDSAAFANFNTKIRNFADSNPDTLVADWDKLIHGNEAEYLLASDGVHQKDEEAAIKYFRLFIDTVNKNTTPMTFEECCDPQDGSMSDQSVWNGAKFMLTEGQARGIAAMAAHANGASVTALKTQVSQMANRFDKYGSKYGDGAAGLIDYVKSDGWYDAAIGAAYDENYQATADYIDAVKDVLIEGNRTIPPQIVRQATAGAAGLTAENEGSAIDLNNRSEFKVGVTEIEETARTPNKWMFYQWADPNGQQGDLFGYDIGNEPAGNSSAGSQASACCENTVGGVTTMEIEGHQYAFPLAGATKSNYLNADKFDSVLSNVPCPSLNCHHDYHAMDLGIKMDMVSGSQASKYGGSADDMFYYSSGAPVVAFTSGTIAYANEYKNGVPSDWWDKCGQIALEGDDGNYYWLGHLDHSATTVKAGDKVVAGQVISAVGAPQCAQNTQAHLHIDNGNGANAKPDTWTIEVINQLWQKLPDSDSGSGMSTCSTGSLPAGGMTQQQADDFMQLYRDLPCPQDDDPWGIAGNSFPGGCGHCLTNCVEFSLYFINRYTTAHFDGLGDGSQVVGQLLESGQGFIDGGHTPKNYAIFSHDSGSFGGAGHTGVVLKVDEANGKIILGEAGCGSSFDWIGAHEYDLAAWKDQPRIKYAYTDNILK